MKKRDFHVGVLQFNEPFGLELIENLNNLETFQDKDGKEVKVHAESILVHEIPIDYRSKYDFIYDRGSHIVRHAIGVFMIYASQGIYLINNPLSFHYFISNKDVGFALTHALGIKVPYTYILPTHTTPMLEREDFNYHRHFDWENIVANIGLPCYIKPAEGRGAFGVRKVNNIHELWDSYNTSGEKVMTVQSAVDSPHDWHVRCLCIGRNILPIKFIFRSHDGSEYIEDENFLSPQQRQKIINSARIINRVFGYEMNSVEFILDYSGEPWAIDFNNPIPDARKQILGETYYNFYKDSVIQRIKEVAIDSPQSLFLPELNEFSSIAQMDLSSQEKFDLALEVANRFYEKD